jgi:uncharacterized protein YbjQ (UPF0145 family)
MNIDQNFSSGKISINIQGVNFTAMFPKLSATPCSDFTSLNQIGLQLGIGVVPFSTLPNLIQNNPEIAFLDGGFLSDKVIFYKDFFVVFGMKPILAYYSKIAPIKANAIEGQYFSVEFSGPEKSSLKDAFKTSVEAYKTAVKQQAEEQSIQQNNEIKQKLDSCLITTTSSLDGYKILEYHGTVSSFSILKLDWVQDFVADIGAIWGGKSKAYMKKYQDLQNDVETRLKFYAIEKGANAVIGTKFDMDFIETNSGEKNLLGTTEIFRKMIIGGSGTAVTIVKAEGQHAS